MIIKWLGHSCFKLESAVGISVVTDPYDNEVGYPEFRTRADIVTVSHAHHDHNNTRAIEGKPLIIDTPGYHKVEGVTIEGSPVSHDDQGGKLRGTNIINVIEMDSLRICHLGDLGHVLTTEQAKALGRVDVLLIPVGGHYTIDARKASEVAALLSPNIIIPMHYKVDCVKYHIAGVTPFIELVQGRYDVSMIGGNSLQVDPGKAKKRQRVIVMNYF
jgi:L-ascorbate metabolism protein UlaG (beta-lactamase superfamily)